MAIKKTMGKSMIVCSPNQQSPTHATPGGETATEIEHRRSLQGASKIRCGRIIVRDGKFVSLRRRWLPGSVSLPRVFWDSYFPPGKVDQCTLDYHQPWGCPGFLTLDYVRSGPRTRFATFRLALAVLDEIATLRGSYAIVAHISTSRISDRLLRRWGWQQHCLHWSGRHWIKRFPATSRLTGSP